MKKEETLVAAFGLIEEAKSISVEVNNGTRSEFVSHHDGKKFEVEVTA